MKKLSIYYWLFVLILLIIPWLFWTSDLSVDKIKFTEEWYKFSLSLIQVYVAFLVFNYLFPNYREKEQNKQKFIEVREELKVLCVILISTFSKLNDTFKPKVAIVESNLRQKDISSKLVKFNEQIESFKELSLKINDKGFNQVASEYISIKERIFDIIEYFKENESSINDVGNVNILILNDVKNVGKFIEKIYNVL